MKLHYMGKFNGDAETLPRGEHKPNAVKFKEFDSPRKQCYNLYIIQTVIGLERVGSTMLIIL